MSKLSDGFTIRGKNIKNRIVMPPMMCLTFKGDNGGMYGKQYVDHYTARAKGGTGLIVVQATAVMGAASQSGVWSDEQMKPLLSIVKNCHQYGATVMIQLAFGDVDSNELSLGQIRDMQADIIAAATRAKEAGFDGVEIHLAHGYTLSKMLDPTYNTRTDDYGGCLENRTRILVEIIPELRAAVGDNMIISVRMGGNIPNSAGAVDIAKVWEKNGIDLLHISFGLKEPANDKPADFTGSMIAYNASKIKKNVHIPIIAVADIVTGEQASFLIDNNYADFVAVGRGIFADENWANKVIANEPVMQCHNCGGQSRKCLWFIDHTKCPAKISSI